MKDCVIVGKILEPYGLKGLVKIISYMQEPKEIFQARLYKIDSSSIEPVTIKLHSVINEQKFKCVIEGASTRTDAERLQKQDLAIEKQDLPELSEGEFYIENLIGALVIDFSGTNIGIVSNVYNFGANDIIEIKFNNGSTEMYDFNDNIFPKIEKDKITFIAPKVL